jgi:hypothetical protein
MNICTFASSWNCDHHCVMTILRLTNNLFPPVDAWFLVFIFFDSLVIGAPITPFFLLCLYCYFHTSPMSLIAFSIPINMIVSRSQSSIYCSYFCQAVLSMIVEVLENITLNGLISEWEFQFRLCCLLAKSPWANQFHF